METYKNIAYQVLKKANKALASKEILKLATRQGLLKTTTEAKEALMTAQLMTDIRNRGKRSLFVRTAPSTFALTARENKKSTGYNRSPKGRASQMGGSR